MFSRIKQKSLALLLVGFIFASCSKGEPEDLNLNISFPPDQSIAAGKLLLVIATPPNQPTGEILYLQQASSDEAAVIFSFNSSVLESRQLDGADLYLLVYALDNALYTPCIVGVADCAGITADPEAAYASNIVKEAGDQQLTLATQDLAQVKTLSDRIIFQANPVNQAPQVSIAANNLNIQVGDNVLFTPTASDDGSIVSYRWDFGDGTYSGTGQPNPYNRTFSAQGTYNVTLTVTDNDGLSSTSAALSVTVDATPVNQAPTVSLSADQLNVQTGEDVIFTPSVTDDGQIASYSWNFGNGTLGGTGNPGPETRSYGSSGTYSASLTVTDDGGLSGTSNVVIISVDAPPANQPPTVILVSSGDNYNTQQQVTFTPTASDSDGNITDFAWSFGDGNQAFGFDNPTPVSHQFVTPGTYGVTLEVTDNDGASTTSNTVTINITSAPPNILPTTADPSSGTAPLTVSFTCWANDPDGDAITYTWDFGDGSANSNQANVDHEYTADGTYTARCRATDTYGVSSAWATNTITVTQNPDGDGDGYNTPADCDDSDPLVNPGTIERCDDAIDNNCDGQSSEGCGKTELDSRKISSPLTLDGQLNEAAWSTADFIHFHDHSRDGYGNSDNYVKVMSLWNGSYLYFAYRVLDYELSAADQLNAYYRDDGSEIYLDVQHDGHDNLSLSPPITGMDNDDYHLMANILGSMTFTQAANSITNHGVMHVTHVRPEGDGYTIEIAIPWNDLAFLPPAFPTEAPDIYHRMGTLIGNNDRDPGTLHSNGEAYEQFDWTFQDGSYDAPGEWFNLTLRD